MNGAMVGDLGIGPGVWLFLTLLLTLTLFFKVGRFWSVRNLDLLMIFALAPGMMMLVGNRGAPTWWSFVLAVHRLVLVDGPLPARPRPGPQADA